MAVDVDGGYAVAAKRERLGALTRPLPGHILREAFPVGRFSMRAAHPLLLVVLAFASFSSGASAQTPPAPSAPPLDFEFFKARVQPIFLAERPGHARCIACHGAGTPLRLQPLGEGRTSWTDEESRKNFDAVRRLVVPGSAKSRLLMHPLAESAGGDFYHNGGKHWSSQDDPEWLTSRRG